MPLLFGGAGTPRLELLGRRRINSFIRVEFEEDKEILRVFL